jgi:AGZA family xanthine/uracil permease-like MFS transporter
MLERLFKLKQSGTDVRTELLGGATTFVTMAYIIVINPAILAHAGIPIGPSTVATAVAAIFGTLLMAFIANRPIAVAPYMGENAFIAFGLIAFGITWQQRLGAVFVSGLAFLIITLLGVRGWIARSISPSLKHSFAVGIGLFLALIGLYETGIVTSSVAGQPPAAFMGAGSSVLGVPDVPLKIGDISSAHVLFAILGFLLIVVLMYLRVPGAMLLGILATAAVGHFAGLSQAPARYMALPFAGDYSLAPIAFQLDIAGVLKFSFLPILLTLFLMGFLDTLGTLIGVGAAGNMLDAKGNFPKIERPMMVDALACTFSGLIGTSTSGAYIESASGIREGARTGLSSLATAVLFAVSLFFLPAIRPLQDLRYAYGPALIVVGLLMLGSIRKIDFDDLTELAPAFATIAMMVFTYNIANGLTAGLVLHPLLKLTSGRIREVTPGGLVLGLACLLYFVFGRPH